MITLRQSQPDQTQATSAARPESVDFDVTEAYGRFGKQLYLFALNALGDAGAAEEATQETFTRAWKARHRYNPAQASQRTWLYAIARNTIKDIIRPRTRIPEPVDGQHIAELSSARDSADPAARLMMVEALSTLSPEHRQAVVAIHVVGLNYTELSESTDIPVSTLRSRTFHGLRALRHHVSAGEVNHD